MRQIDSILCFSDEKDRAWFQERTQSASAPRLNILVLCLREDRIPTGYAALSSAGHDGCVPLSFAGEAEYRFFMNEPTELFVPPEALDYHITLKETYRNKLTRHFSGALRRLLETPENPRELQQDTLIVFEMPPHMDDERNRSAYLPIFSKAADRWSPENRIALVHPPRISPSASVDATPSPRLRLVVDQTWTTLLQSGSGGDVVKRCTAALPLPRDGNVKNFPVNLRINDYLNRRNGAWRQETHESWAAALRSVCGALRKDGWEPSEDAVIECPAGAYQVLRETVLASGLVTKKKTSTVALNDAPARTIVEALLKRVPRQRGKEIQKPTKKTSVHEKVSEQSPKKSSIFDILDS